MVRGILFEYVPYDFPSHVSRLTREETRSGKVCLLTFLTIRELRRMDDYKKNVIEMVREHIFLWNPVHRDYKNKEQRKQAWEDIDKKIQPPTGSGQVFVANPTNFTADYTQTLELNCNIKTLMHAVSQVFVLQIDREESGSLVPIATVTPAGVSINSHNKDGRYTASGDVSQLRNGPYLNISISQPNKNDSGHYVCVASITDKTSTLAKLTYDLNIQEEGLSEDEIRALVLTVAGKIDRVEMANSNLVKTITRLERQNMDLQKNLTDAAGENNNLRANFSSLELRLKAVEQQLEQERRENNSTDSDVLTKITDLENQILGINLIPGGSGNTNTVVSNCSCCDAYADISKDVSQLQSGQSDLLRQLKESVTNRTNLASDLVKFDSRLDSVSLRLDVLENSTTAHSGIITTLQNSLSTLTRKPQAFSARRSSYTASNPNQTIVGDVGNLTFNTVVLDNYQAFDTSTGQLTIVQPGHYMISLTLSLNMVLSSSMEAGIMVNGNFIGFLSTSSTGILNSGSTTVVVKLAAGDKVKAKVVKVIAQPITLNSDMSIISVMYLG
ncbi:hypothetical protein RRG08_029358 [Elysia crispata]|uniref:Uncharacterized protein n=2 Tax=Elysia crispata TaxID=231223 RepID=A0AAE1B7N0_9GAST|nr:hypothetical protein RRG08_029358 [Elysia crispata]